MYAQIPESEVERRIATSHESVRAVVAYWRQKAGTRPMPGRRDIDPAEIKPYLSAVILVDVVPDERRFVYRLVGTHEVAGRGMDPTGLAVRDSFYAESQEAALGTYEYVVREKRPFCCCDPYVTPDGWQEHEDVVYLPLSDDGEQVNMVLVYSYSHQFKARTGASLVVR
jgi:hypothetical protein